MNQQQKAPVKVERITKETKRRKVLQLAMEMVKKRPIIIIKKNELQLTSEQWVGG